MTQQDSKFSTPAMVSFQTAVLSQPGGRQVNEDWCLWTEVGPHLCWVVADGLGGHNGGEVASKTVVDTILESFKSDPELSHTALERHIESAQQALAREQQQTPALAEMRTTVVVLLSDSHVALWAHIGDSRLYSFKRSGLFVQTEDHSVPQALAKAGDIRRDEIRSHRDRNRLLRSLGEQGPARPTFPERTLTLGIGDAFLLCTDGFWEHVLETEMMADLVATSSATEWLNRSESRLLARVTGTHDNYSAIAVRVAPAPDLIESAGRSVADSAGQLTRELAEL